MNEYEKQLLIANIKESLISKIINIDLDIKDAKTKLELLKHNVEMYQKVLKNVKDSIETMKKTSWLYY